METKKKVASIVYDVLNQIREGITDYEFHKIIKQTKDYLIVNVSYTWSLHGHKNPVKKVERILYKENGNWKLLA